MATKYENKYVGEVLVKYKKILESELKRELKIGIKKSGSRLEESIVVKKLTGLDGIGVSMNEYGLNVNQGRRPGKMPGKPPMSNLRERIDRYGIKPKKRKDGRTPTIDQLVYLIGESIKKNGIQPTRFIDIVIDRVEPQMTLDLVNAYLRSINEQLDETTPNASSKN